MENDETFDFNKVNNKDTLLEVFPFRKIVKFLNKSINVFYVYKIK